MQSDDQRMWDSEKRNSPYSTVADIEDESCECCGGDHDISECPPQPDRYHGIFSGKFEQIDGDEVYTG